MNNKQDENRSLISDLSERLLNGMLKENPTLVLMLGMCPTLAVTTSAINGLGMGVSTMLVLAMSNLIISLLRKIIPDKIRIPAFIVIIASFVTIVELLMKGYIPSLYSALGLYIPLIVVNCIILGRAESYAYKNPALLSLFDGLGMGMGFTFSLTLIGAIRELLGSGKVFNVYVMPEGFVPVSIFVMAPGAFFVLALLTAIQDKVKEIGERHGKDMSKIQSGCGGNCLACDKSCKVEMIPEEPEETEEIIETEETAEAVAVTEATETASSEKTDSSNETSDDMAKDETEDVKNVKKAVPLAGLLARFKEKFEKRSEGSEKKSEAKPEKNKKKSEDGDKERKKSDSKSENARKEKSEKVREESESLREEPETVEEKDENIEVKEEPANEAVDPSSDTEIPEDSGNNGPETETDPEADGKTEENSPEVYNDQTLTEEPSEPETEQTKETGENTDSVESKDVTETRDASEMSEKTETPVADITDDQDEMEIWDISAYKRAIKREIPSGKRPGKKKKAMEKAQKMLNSATEAGKEDNND